VDLSTNLNEKSLKASLEELSSDGNDTLVHLDLKSSTIDFKTLKMFICRCSKLSSLDMSGCRDPSLRRMKQYYEGEDFTKFKEYLSNIQ